MTIQLTVPRNQRFELTFAHLGLPPGATAHSCLTMSLDMERPVALIHETGQMIGSPGLRDPVAFYARPLVKPGVLPDWTHAKVQIHTTWAPPPVALEAHELLVSGLLAYGDEDFNRAVLDLHTGLDVLSAHRAEHFLPALGLPKKARAMLTLSERLAFIQLHANQTLTQQANTAVQALTKLRNNKVAHTGHSLTLTDVVEPVCGAVAVLWWLYALPTPPPT